MKHEYNLTSKGQVTVPKDIRDALGLVPGRPVRFELDEDGNARIFNAADPARIEARKQAYLARVRGVQAKFKGHDKTPDMDGLTYQRWIRGDGPEV